MPEARRGRDGGLRLSFEPSEAACLVELPFLLRDEIENPQDDRVAKRLFPPGSNDEQVADEYAEMIGADLRAGKLARVDEFQENLRLATMRRGRLRIDLSPEQVEHWLGFLNDMRLTLGTQLDIEEDWDLSDDPEEDEELYFYLTQLQGWLIAVADA